MITGHTSRLRPLTFLLTIFLMNANAVGQTQVPSQDLRFDSTPVQERAPGNGGTEFTMASNPNFLTLRHPGSNHTFAFGLNNLGMIVGEYIDAAGTPFGFVFSAGKFTTISYPGSVATQAQGINDLGEIVGSYGVTFGFFQGFSLKNGVFSQISYPGSVSTYVTGINNLGEIVGIYFDQSSHQHGFLDSGGVYTTIDPPNSASTLLGGINSSGEIVGSYCVSPCTQGASFTYSNGVFTNFNFALPNALYGINTQGFLSGAFSPASGSQSDFVYDPTSGKIISFDIGGSSDTAAYGINDKCSVAGFFTDPRANFYGFYIQRDSCP
jgi:hypothetical protein